RAADMDQPSFGAVSIVLAWASGPCRARHRPRQARGGQGRARRGRLGLIPGRSSRENAKGRARSSLERGYGNMDGAGERTRVTLPGRLRRDPSDQAAWREFVEHYGPRVYGWCRKWGLQESDAQDVTQNVLLRLSQKMGQFAYDPSLSFRAWLKTLTHHAWSDFLQARRRPGLGSGD